MNIWETICGILIAIFALLAMVTIHEAGHYTVAKLLKFQISEFSIGFGKAIYKKKLKNGELFSIRMLPLGGYCAFDGEDDDGKSDTQNPRAFNKQKPWKRILVLLAGATFNIISAILIIALTFTFYGDVLPCTEIKAEYVQTNSAFLDNDIIVSIDDTNFSFFSTNFAYAWGEGEHRAVVKRMGADGKRYETLVTFKGEDYSFIDSSSLELYAYYAYKYQDTTASGFENFEFDDQKYSGYTEVELKKNYDSVQELINRGNCVTYSFYRVRFGIFEAFGRGFVSVFRMAWMIISIFIGLFTGSTPISSMGGPITTISVLGQTATKGVGMLMYFVCLISANLAVFNLLPIPSLDGSKTLFVAIEWIRKKPINPKIEGLIHFIGLVVIFGFAILVDLLRWF